MKLYNVQLLRYADLHLEKTALEEIKTGLTKASVYIEQALLRDSRNPAPFLDMGTIQDIQYGGPTQVMSCNILVTDFKKDMIRMNDTGWQGIGVEVEYQTKDEGQIRHIDYPRAYMRYSDQRLFITSGEEKINFRERNEMYFDKVEKNQLKAFGYSDEEIQEAEYTSTFKVALFDAQVRASGNGMSQSDIDTIMKRPTPAESKFDKAVIEACNEAERNTDRKSVV